MYRYNDIQLKMGYSQLPKIRVSALPHRVDICQSCIIIRQFISFFLTPLDECLYFLNVYYFFVNYVL